MVYANTKFSKGYATTGVGLVLCARHGFIQLNGVGDLQKGERYVDVVWSIMKASNLQDTIDIVTWTTWRCLP